MLMRGTAVSVTGYQSKREMCHSTEGRNFYSGENYFKAVYSALMNE
jgi:hypothetical protein